MHRRQANLENQLLLPGDFFLPFGGKLDTENRWVKLSVLVPWAQAEKNYGAFFKKTFRGQETISLRKGLGALIIQERMQLTDRETLETIKENPYMQFFIGLPGYEHIAPFHHSMMTHFRKRLVHVLQEINEIVALEGAKASSDSDDDPNVGSGGARRTSQRKKQLSSPEQAEWPLLEEQVEREASTQKAVSLKDSNVRTVATLKTCEPTVSENEPELPNHGSLLVDATCAPADVAYPTDLNLLNEAREKLEAIIDTLHEPDIGEVAKPRTYREKARKQYLVVSKQRRAGVKVIRKAIGRQLCYVKRNLDIIADQTKRQSLMLLSRKAHRDLLVIHELYRQQRQMYKQRSHQVEDRIVSIHQPHVRPIVRGKAKARVEFGAKIAVSMMKGFALVDHLSWDNFNESTTLIASIEKYRGRMGYYPAVVQADQIYRTRENRSFCKKHGIRMSGPALGRPSKESVPIEQKRVTKADAGERNGIEGKFGEGKRKYGLGRIRAHLRETSESVITLQMLVMNLERRLRLLFCLFSNYVYAVA